MNDDVFPRRNLGPSDYWGRVVENRLIDLSRKSSVSRLSLQGMSRGAEASDAELARNLKTLQEQYDEVYRLAGLLPATGNVAVYSSNFALTPGWQTVATGKIPAVPGRENLSIKGMGVVRVIDTGTGPGPTPGPTPSGAFSWPFPTSSVTSEYGPRDGRMHQGIDFGQPEGTVIRAANDGTVLGVGYGSGTGNYVDLIHSGNIVTRYFHMVVMSDFLTIGQSVTKGQNIGRVGNTGNSFGDHLHWETIVNGVHQNPRDFMAAYGDGSSGGGGGGGEPTVPTFGRPRAKLVLNGIESREFFPHRDLTSDEGTLNQIFPLSLANTTGTDVTVDVQVYAEADVPANEGNFARLTVKAVFTP